MQRENLKKILEMMVKEGVIRITCSPDPSNAVEIWSRHSCELIDGRDLEYWHPSREEIEYYAKEYDKCFGTAPRSDE
jgi:hypothetical protein